MKKNKVATSNIDIVLKETVENTVSLRQQEDERTAIELEYNKAEEDESQDLLKLQNDRCYFGKHARRR